MPRWQTGTRTSAPPEWSRWYRHVFGECSFICIDRVDAAIPIGRSDIPANTLRNNDVVITSKRRHFDVITSKWRRFDVITTLLIRHVFGGCYDIACSTVVTGAEDNSELNSLALVRFEYFRQVIFKLILVMDGWDIFYEITLWWISLDFTDNKSPFVQVMAWRRQATSHWACQVWIWCSIDKQYFDNVEKLGKTTARGTWWRHQIETFSIWPFVRGIHQSAVNSPHKGKWRGALRGYYSRLALLTLILHGHPRWPLH